METKTLDRIRALRRQGEEAASFWERYRETTRDSRCDKHEAKFNGDDRFTVFSTNVRFCALTGYYGHSGCSRFGSFNPPEIVQEHFIKALNKHKELLFSTMAESMREEAASLVETAEAELATMQDMLNSARAVESEAAD